jgi:hypothetical protein
VWQLNGAEQSRIFAFKTLKITRAGIAPGSKTDIGYQIGADAQLIEHL